MRGSLSVLLVLLVPAAGALPMTAYGHLVDGLHDFPITAQEPDPSFTAFHSLGVTTHSTGCVVDVPDSPVTADRQWHTFYGFASAEHVEYGATADGRPRVHPERGVGFDATIDPAAPATVHWYLATDVGGASVAPVPNVRVAATLREGGDIGTSDEHYNEGTVIADGVSAPVHLAPGAPEHSVVDGRDVFHFEVPLTVHSSLLPKGGFDLRIDVGMDTPLCGPDGAPMPNAVALHTSHDHRPRLELEVLQAVQVVDLQPAQNDTHALLAGDVQMLWTPGVPPLQVRLTGPAGDLPVEVSVSLDAYCHCSPRPLPFTAAADVAGAPPGLYAWNVTVGDGDAHAAADWTIEASRDASGPLLPAIALAVLAAALAWRARRS